MARKRPDASAPAQDGRAIRLAALARLDSIAGVPGPGRWLITEYEPTALFSLKISLATSSVGKTLVVPTPYSIKMAFVDAAFRAGLSAEEAGEFLRSLVNVDVRMAPPLAACVTHTFVKIRQESRGGDPLRPYIPSIAYRELVHHHGTWQWAFDLARGDDTMAERLVHIAPHIAYIGKRGSFVRFMGLSRRQELGAEFTQPVQNEEVWTPPTNAHIVALDDFGSEANLEILSSFTATSPKRDRHRRFVETIVPLGLVNTGPGFSEYRMR
ncbi:MAG TPA: hypothetical protein VFS39_16885 [Nitrospira sp.]|nr:hypothetical protein [Nitrospira sp.]